MGIGGFSNLLILNYFTSHIVEVAMGCFQGKIYDMESARSDSAFTPTVGLNDIKRNLQDDLEKNVEKAKLPSGFVRLGDFTLSSTAQNSVSISVNDGNIQMDISACKNELVSTYYFGMQKLGFLFPHPRIQISPSIERIRGVGNSIFKLGLSFPYGTPK